MRKPLLLILFLLTGTCALNAQVGIGTASPNASAALDVTSSTGGLLIPRITSANRPVNPATGLMIYQTDSAAGFYYYNGTAWTKVSTTAADTLTQNLYTNGYRITGDGTYGMKMSENGMLMSNGILGNGSDLDNINSGETHMIWYPKYGAFRAGRTIGNEWDWANTGEYSLAVGYGVRAGGSYCVALGYKTTAVNQSSFATNEGSIASGFASVAMGYYAHTNARRGSFVFADNSAFPNGSGNEFRASVHNSFNVKVSGGYFLYSDTTASGENAMTFQRGKLGIGTNATPSSTLQVAGSISVKRTAVTEGYTATATDYLLAVPVTTPVTINLPPAATAGTGRVYIIKAETSAAPSIIIDGNGAETIDNAATKTITTAAGTLSIYSNGSSWWSF